MTLSVLAFGPPVGDSRRQASGRCTASRPGERRRDDHRRRIEGDVRLAVLLGQPSDVQDEILRTNEEARPVALQIALLVPLIASLLGLLAGFLTTRLPDPKPSAAAETLLAG